MSKKKTMTVKDRIIDAIRGFRGDLSASNSRVATLEAQLTGAKKRHTDDLNEIAKEAGVAM